MHRSSRLKKKRKDTPSCELREYISVLRSVRLGTTVTSTEMDSRVILIVGRARIKIDVEAERIEILRERGQRGKDTQL